MWSIPHRTVLNETYQINLIPASKVQTLALSMFLISLKHRGEFGDTLIITKSAFVAVKVQK